MATELAAIKDLKALRNALDAVTTIDGQKTTIRETLFKELANQALVSLKEGNLKPLDLLFRIEHKALALQERSVSKKYKQLKSAVQKQNHNAKHSHGLGNYIDIDNPQKESKPIEIAITYGQNATRKIETPVQPTPIPSTPVEDSAPKQATEDLQEVAPSTPDNAPQIPLEAQKIQQQIDANNKEIAKLLEERKQYESPERIGRFNYAKPGMEWKHQAVNRKIAELEKQNKELKYKYDSLTWHIFLKESASDSPHYPQGYRTASQQQDYLQEMSRRATLESQNTLPPEIIARDGFDPSNFPEPNYVEDVNDIDFMDRQPV